MGDKEYNEIVKQLKETLHSDFVHFYDIFSEKQNYKQKIDISHPFSILNLPSQGKFYKNKQSYVLVRYLTAVEEQVLSDEFLVESGQGIKMVIENLLMTDIPVGELVLGDFQSILIFLRSTAYGDSIEVSPVCPYCKKKAESLFKLSSLEFKEQENEPDSNGKFTVRFEGKDIDIVVKPMRFKELLEYSKELEENFEWYQVDGKRVKIKKTQTLNLVYNIESINGYTDKKIIAQIINKLPKKNVDQLKTFIKNNETGVQDKMLLTCSYCGSEFEQNVDIGYNFISLPAKYREIILEEIFLITYYGKGITRADALSMPVYERKWHIRRIKEELDKKHKAETAAMNKAKRK